MSNPSRNYWSDKVQRGEPIEAKFFFKITAAKTAYNQTANAVLVAWDAIAAQATIDDFLGTTDEFLIASFDATAMGTDAIAFIVDLQGQCKELVSAKVKLMSGTNLSTVVKTGDNASTTVGTTLVTTFAAGANGNVAGHAVLSGIDILTSGMVELTLNFRSY
jgi:hypothetical protein